MHTLLSLRGVDDDQKIEGDSADSTHRNVLYCIVIGKGNGFKYKSDNYDR